MSVSVATAARTARRSALFTFIAVVERAATGPSASPVSGVERLGVRSAPGDPDDLAIGLAHVEVALLKRFEHRGRPVVAGRPDRRHHLGAVAEAALRQLGDQLLERLRPDRSAAKRRARARAGARQDGAFGSPGVGERAEPAGPARDRQFVVPPHSPVAAL